MDVVEKMAESSSVTKEKILESAKKEFLENGFVNASLRTIAANAGLTTGAMIYVVIEELVPEMAEGEHSNWGTITFMLGFTLMMILDVALG